MLTETVPALDLPDQALAEAVESLGLSRPMARHRVAGWRYSEDRLFDRSGGKQGPVLDLLRAVLEAARDSVTFSTPMDGEAVDRWRAEAFELREDVELVAL